MPYDWLTGLAVAPPVPGYGPRTPNLVGVGAQFPLMGVGPTGTQVRTDPAATAGLGHPPWLDSLYPKAPGTPQYHTYTPAKGGWKLPSGTHLTWEPGKGYIAKPGPAQKAATPAAPTDPWTKLLTQLMGSYETPAQQEARVNREINTQIAAQKKMMDDEYARQQANAQAMARGQELAGAAAAAMSKDLFGAVGGEFNAAAGEIKGLAHSLSKSANAATSGEMAAANANLGALGNEAVSTGGTFGIGGGKQAGVEEYRGGTLAGQMFGTQGEAANFGLAGMIASGGMKAHEEAQAALITATREINDNQNKAIAALAAGRGDLYHTYMADAQDAQIKRLTLAQGIQAAQTATKGTTKPITKLVGGNLMQWVPDATKPAGGSWVRAVKGNTAQIAAKKAADKKAADAAKRKAPNASLSRIYHHVVDSDGNAILGPDGKLQPVGDTKGDESKVYLELSKAMHKWVDHNGIPIPSLNKPGMPKPPPIYKPGTGKDKSGKPKVTAEQKQQGWDMIREHQALVRAQMKLKAYNDKKIAEGAFRDKKKTIPWKTRPMTMEEISNATPTVLAALGMTAAEGQAAQDPHTLQQVYIDLVHSGIDGREAVRMMQKYYPNFGQSYYT